MKILAIVPARSASKRLSGKNIRRLGGKPLFVWSIDVVKGIPEICDILVSTDDPAIAEMARAAGALVPWLRPTELATDMATTAEVCLHALDWYEHAKGKVDGVLLLQPTSPFRRKETVLQGIELFRQHEHRTVLGVSPAKPHPMWCLKVEGMTLRPFIENNGFHLRSQDLPPAYNVNGALYLIAPHELRKGSTFYNNNEMPLIMSRSEECMDIDTEWDWKLAVMYLEMQATDLS